MPLHIENRPLDSRECKILAEMTKEVRNETALSNDSSFEREAENIEKLSQSEKCQIFIAVDDDEIIGWTYDYVGFPLMTFISGFFPVVQNKENLDEIALALIESEQANCRDAGRTRLEIELEFHSQAHRELSKKYLKWYLDSSFQFAAEEKHMKADVNTVELPYIDCPTGFEIKKFSQTPYEELETAGYKTFENSKDTLFLSMTHAEQKVTLEHFFDKENSYVDESSPILAKDDEIVGFVITRLKGNEADIGPVGLIPEFRQQGLGSYLLVYTLRNLRNNRVEKAVLDMSKNNEPAYNLYKKYGFIEDYSKQFYYWTP